MNTNVVHDSQINKIVLNYIINGLNAVNKYVAPGWGMWKLEERVTYPPGQLIKQGNMSGHNLNLNNLSIEIFYSVQTRTDI